MSRTAEYNASAQERLTAAKAIYDEVFTKQDGQETPEQRAEVIRLNKEASEFMDQAGKSAEWDAAGAAIKNGLDYLARPERGFRYGVESRGDALALKSVGETYIESDEFKNWWKMIAPSGTLLDGQKIGNSPALQLGFGLKSLMTGLTTWTARSDTNAGALVQLDQRGLVDGGVYRRPLRIANLIPKSTTSGDTIEYVRVTGFTNSAAPVAEATATSGSSGAKPESGHTFEVVQDRVRTIAHWEPITRQALSDAGQMRGLIDMDLRYGLEEELEDQILSGDGTGQNFTGVLSNSGILTQAFNTDILTTTRKAITHLLLAGREMASGWVMNPNNWEQLELLQDNEGRYYWGGPQTADGTPRLWGLPLVQSEGIAANTAILANWQKARLWDREQTNIYVSDSHADFFIRNLLAILAEMRMGFGLLKPRAFEKVTLA